ILLGAGLIPPYFEIAKRHGQVIGINFVFLFIDFLGAFFSLMSLVTDIEFDLLGGIMYCVVMLLELGIMSSHAVWLIRQKMARRRGEASVSASQFHTASTNKENNMET